MHVIPESSAVRATRFCGFENQRFEIPEKFGLSQARAESLEHPRRESVLPKAAFVQAAFVQHRFTATMPHCEVEGGLS